MREERRREIDGEDRVGVPVVPFDEIAGRSADDVTQAMGVASVLNLKFA
jgi:hypothetical protein